MLHIQYDEYNIEPWEHATFVEAVEQHGKDYALIEKAVGTKTRRQIHSYSKDLCRRIKADNNRPDAHIYHVLKNPLLKRSTWIKDEHASFLKVVR